MAGPKLTEAGFRMPKKEAPTLIEFRQRAPSLIICCILMMLTTRNLTHLHKLADVPNGEKIPTLSTLGFEDPAPFERLSSLTWELHEYSKTTHQSSIPPADSTRPRLLIAQTTSDFYKPLFDIGRPLNQEYARVHSHDFVVASGIYLLDETKNETEASVPESRATYNKIALLSYALRQGKYDKLLVLDSDAVIRNFDLDFATYGSDPQVMLFAHAVATNQPGNHWNINIGVTLWNLHQDLLRPTWYDWYNRSMSRVYRGLVDEDQAVLHNILREMPDENRPVRGVNKLFNGKEAALIQHIMRSSTATFAVMDESRVETMNAAAQETVALYKALLD
ncbi:predicted protein [Phaeodactylum tricornutum CCAP 1055/1]|jgi:hypothetical protein|uniref:Nucleotide-diphospho-sugar transferase domain-containing protein n=2 Tax=Phaeodactylum tricornutum TaxID=2850 RepID=B7S3U5_PHATC|nr:predicted protein [Phaeodactylum tricornutum CCAP 1055/1]EEC42779.1 predicted protein [Phaeodactylum tricornutum CCAP 1055/1]|eukprot:XP_002176235.1 predicted protein [Phaeodactylum tricornutum CCAP 1055/1]